MPPPTRREQVQLDELLSDIYRGIETLPDNNNSNTKSSGGYSRSNNTREPAAYKATSYQQVKEYELPASSPLVQRHKQELAALRNQQQQQYSQPQRSTLKRHSAATSDSTQAASQKPQSLANFITSGGGASVTPDSSKRRVRILDPGEKKKQSNSRGNWSDDDYPTIDDNDTQSAAPSPYKQSQFASGVRTRGQHAQSPASGKAATGGSKREKVKYVNTNKFIYHQEKNPDDLDLSDDENDSEDINGDNNNENDDDIDGVTKVEYYHTSWLDRQLGRASKRRSSKELTERQVKEKAMIEELKRSLKSGAITLKQSFKGNPSKQQKHHQFIDDSQLNVNSSSSAKNKYNKHKQSSVVKSGLATVPRNYQSNKQKYSEFDSVYRKVTGDYSDDEVDDDNENIESYNKSHRQPDQNVKPTVASSNIRQQASQPSHNNSYLSQSRTLPHKTTEQPVATKTEPHQLLKSHISNKGSTLQRPSNYHTTPAPSQYLQQSSYQSLTRGQQQQQPSNDSIMRNPNNLNNCTNTNTSANYYSSSLGGQPKGPLQYPHNQHLNTQFSSQLQNRPSETISSIPSATEVVRSALSRSSSQVSLNQLNKTISLLPNSPPPSSPMTPTQQLRAASPSLSPSPFGHNNTMNNQPRHQQVVSPHYSSKTMATSSPYNQQQTQQPIRVTGTRTLERPVQQQPQYQQQRQTPVYANPHASLIQHKQEQQSRQQNKNSGSIREFNELDSLLRSLSPQAGGVTTHVTPGFSRGPAQPAFGGYGGTYPAQQPHQQQPYRQPQQQQQYNQQQQQPLDVYSRVQKPAGAAPNDQSRASYLQQHYMAPTGNQSSHQPFTIDVTDKKADENCLTQARSQNLSEFEPPIELLPSMEDYQNISKLNPVRNHYWYKPNMSRDRAIGLLKDKPQGTFIVRDSTSFKGAFGLAVKVARLPRNVLNNASLRDPNGDPSSELIRHFLIEPTGDGVRLKGYANEPVFTNLANLIYQHSLTELALPCKLVIPRADIEDPKFNQKQRQYYDEFLASKEQAKHNPYERTSPNGGYRRYPGDVLVHNEHRIIFEWSTNLTFGSNKLLGGIRGICKRRREALNKSWD